MQVVVVSKPQIKGGGGGGHLCGQGQHPKKKKQPNFYM
jgi:hypothetical protein